MQSSRQAKILSERSPEQIEAQAMLEETVKNAQANEDVLKAAKSLLEVIKKDTSLRETVTAQAYELHNSLLAQQNKLSQQSELVNDSIINFQEMVLACNAKYSDKSKTIDPEDYQAIENEIKQIDDQIKELFDLRKGHTSKYQMYSQFSFRDKDILKSFKLLNANLAAADILIKNIKTTKGLLRNTDKAAKDMQEKLQALHTLLTQETSANFEDYRGIIKIGTKKGKDSRVEDENAVNAEQREFQKKIKSDYIALRSHFAEPEPTVPANSKVTASASNPHRLHTQGSQQPAKSTAHKTPGPVRVK